ncbi:probable ADP,ATP carrier protein [Tanacetum coccineum]
MVGAAAGCTTLVIIYPLDIAHTQLAADDGRKESLQFKGICHFLTIVWTKMSSADDRGLYLDEFDIIKEKMSKDASSKVALWNRWIVAQAVTTNTFDCWKTIYTNMFRSTGAAAVLVLYDEV